MYCFGSERLHGYHAIYIMRQELLIELRTTLRKNSISISCDSRLTDVASDGPEKVDLIFDNGQNAFAELPIGADGIHLTARQTFMTQVDPMHAGFIGIGGIVKRSHIRMPVTLDHLGGSLDTMCIENR